MIETVYHGADVEERQLRDLVATENSAEEEPAETVTVEERSESETGGEEAANQAPVIRFVDLLLRQAAKNRASDIHIEPQTESTSVRVRVDGVLREMVPPPKRMHAAVVARVKILAQMNIAERRLPQVGEESGSLSVMLRKTSDHYERRITATIDAMTGLLEPVMITMIGSIVLVVVIALYLPIFTISDVAH